MSKEFSFEIIENGNTEAYVIKTRLNMKAIIKKKFNRNYGVKGNRRVIKPTCFDCSERFESWMLLIDNIRFNTVYCPHCDSIICEEGYLDEKIIREIRNGSIPNLL